MSKSEGTKIAIKFTEDLVGGFTPPLSPIETQDGEWSANGTYSGSLESARDGSTSTYWQSRSTSNYIQITRPETKMMGVRVYKGSSYRPSGFTLSVSEDGTSFTEVATGTFTSSTGWETVMLDTPIVSDYFRINFGYSSRLYLYELVLLVEGYENLTFNDFIITGKQQKHINGELVDKRYEVKKYEMIPIKKVWELGENLELDAIGELSVTDKQCYEITSGTTLTGTVQASSGDYVLATISHRSEFTTPSGWTKLYESDAIGSNQKMVFAIKKVDTTGQVSFTAIQSSAGRIYLNLISISGLYDIENASEYEAISTVDTPSIPVPNKQIGERLIWGASANLWAISDFGSWAVSPDDLELVSLPSTVQARQLNAIDLGAGQATNRQFIPNVGTGSTLVVSAVRLIIQGYETSKTYTSQSIQLDGEYIIKWQETKPEDTDIIIEYTTGEAQGQWQQVSDGEVIVVDTNVWIKATLSTENETVTPILQDLWLEEPTSPQDTLLLTIDWWSRFNNVEGKIKVKYDDTKGTLYGLGGSVVSFEREFLPTDLIKSLDPHDTNTFTATANAIIDFINVVYHNRYTTDTFAITANATINFEYVGEINP